MQSAIRWNPSHFFYGIFGVVHQFDKRLEGLGNAVRIESEILLLVVTDLRNLKGGPVSLCLSECIWNAFKRYQNGLFKQPAI
jgi:hypothetical protein